MKVALASCLVLLAAPLSIDVTQAAEKDQILDEILVRGMRPKPHELRRMIVEAEDRFYERYNELNRKDEFDVDCIVFANTGTNLKHRSCRGVFERTAIQKEARDVFLIRQEIQAQISSGGVQFLPGGGGPPAGAEGEIHALRPAFQANMLRVVQKDRELKELLKQRAMLEKLLGELKRRGSDAAVDGETNSGQASGAAP
jgi:hypothetical protein